jgi:hypothetical protein
MDQYIFQPPRPSLTYTSNHPTYYTQPVPHLLLIGKLDTIIIYHGNASDSEIMSRWASLFNNNGRGHTVILVEYPGYGPYSGPPDRSVVHNDVYKLAKHIYRPNQRLRSSSSLSSSSSNLSSRRYHIIGQSIGTGPAALLATQLHKLGKIPASLTLITPYTCISDLAGDIVGNVVGPVGPVGPVVRMLCNTFMYNDFTPFEYCQNLRHSLPHLPIYIHHGTKDEIINYSHAKQFDNIGCNLKTYDCSHNDILQYATAHIVQDLKKMA